jgi:hypothetical protein
MTNKKKKTVMLPKHMEPQARLFAEIACELEGLTPSSSQYKKIYKQAYYDFCLEAYKHSLSPSGELGANPKAGHASSITKDHMMAVNKMTDIWAEKLPKDAREKITTRLRSSITNLTHLFFEVQKSYNTKGRGEKGKKGREARKTHASDYEITSSMKGDYGQMAQVMIRLYERNFMATVITMAIYGVFSADYANTQEMLSTFIPEIKNSDWENPKRLYTKLRKKENRDQFIRAIVYHLPLGELMPKGQKVYKLAKGKPSVMPEQKERILKSKLNQIASEILTGTNLKSKKDSDGSYYQLVNKEYDFTFDGILVEDLTKALALQEDYNEKIKKKNHGLPDSFLKWDAFRDMRIKNFDDRTYSELTEKMKAIAATKRGVQVELFGNNPSQKTAKRKTKKKVTKKTKKRPSKK